VPPHDPRSTVIACRRVPIDYPIVFDIWVAREMGRPVARIANTRSSNGKNRSIGRRFGIRIKVDYRLVSEEKCSRGWLQLIRENPSRLIIRRLACSLRVKQLNSRRFLFHVRLISHAGLKAENWKLLKIFMFIRSAFDKVSSKAKPADSRLCGRDDIQFR